MSGEGYHASGPPFQQRPFQQGPPSSNYQQGPPPPPPIPASGRSLGQQYVNPSSQGQGRQYYSAGIHHTQRAQSMFQGQPQLPTPVPGNTVQRSLVGQGPPRGPFCSVGAPYDSYRYPMSQRPQFPSMVPPPPLPASLAQSPSNPLSLPPGTSPSPAHEVQSLADDLGQSCSNDSRRNEEESDPVDSLITLNQSVDNLPAHGNSLEKGGSGGSSLQHHNLTDAVMSFSPSNSDMDMEDDITHPAEDESICPSNFNHGSSTELVTDSQTAVEHDRVSVGSDISRDPESGSRNSFKIFDSSKLSKQSEPPVNCMTHQSSCPHEVSVDSAGKNLEKPANDTTKASSPLNLLGDYSSDDSAENSEAHVRAAKPEVAPSVTRDCAASFGRDMENNLSDDHEPQNLLNSEKGVDPLVESSGLSSGFLKSIVKSQSNIPEADVGSSAAGDFGDRTDHTKGSQETSKVGSPLEVIRDDAKTGISQKEELKGTSGKSKVDEFGRLVREDHSDNDSNKSPRFTRRRSKRGRSRSWSRSPIRRRSRSRSRSPRGRRRRSSWRRRGRRGRSRSSSPKRRRSRSKSSSYRHGGDIGKEKTRRHNDQLPECLDYIRGKCHRGASCRYLHHQSVKTTDRLQSSHMKQQSHDILPVPKISNVHGDMNPISPRSAYEYKEHDESQNSKQEAFFTGESGGVIEELPRTETPVGVPSDIFNCQTQLMDGQVAAEISLQSSTPLAPESIMPQSYLPDLSPSVGNHSSNVLGGNLTTSTNQISRDHDLILQHSQFPPPSTTSWNPLPPPPPLPIPFHNNSVGKTASGLPLAQFQQNMQPPGRDLPFQASIGVGQPGMYPKMPEPHKYSYDSNRFGPRIMPVMSKPMDQIHGPSSHMHPYMHHSHYGPLPTPEGVPVHYGEPGKAISTLSNCSSDNPEMSQPQHFTELGGPRFSNHRPPLAPILNEPLISKFSSNIVTQGKDIPSSDMYGNPYGLNHASANGQPTTGCLPAPAADQYDPLYDSIEPSSSSAKKLDFSHKLPFGDSDIVLRTSGPKQLLDVDGNNKQKGIGCGEGFLSPENDAYGETADAEVGDVEDGSASNPQSAADMATEEDEINQVKTSGKTEKGKDSKSMKFFKIAIADFVKEVLKPSWRQGNMSKEAFKTIVKKTVDKVSVATGKHHVPKSREKIDLYIDSQQRKLTKLVMGYVDKYVKA